MEIQKAITDQSDELARLAQIAFPGYPFEYVFNKEGVQTALINNELRYVLTDESGQIMGSAVLGVEVGPMSEIKRVMVHPDHRSNGVATELTRHLTKIAIDLGKIPYAEARADQPAMQKAALNAGMTAIALEPGKHVVYEHMNKSSHTGPARETMIFMTSAKVGLDSLSNALRNLSPRIREQLSVNMQDSLSPKPKSVEVVQNTLISPTESKREVLNKLLTLNKGGDNLKIINDDIAIWNTGDSSILFILPDKSAFVTISNTRHIDYEVITNSGVQVSTIYSDMTDYMSNSHLIHTSYVPTSIRLWRNEDKDDWQVAWQLRQNGYENCLHTIKLNDVVKSQIEKVIRIIKN